MSDKDAPCGCEESQDYLQVLRTVYKDISMVSIEDRTTIEAILFAEIIAMTKKYNRLPGGENQ